MGLNVLTMSIKPTWISVYVGPAPNMQRGADSSHRRGNADNRNQLLAKIR